MSSTQNQSTVGKIDAQSFWRMPGHWTEWPIATMVVVIITTVLSILQFPYPKIREALWRNPDEIKGGEWWRLFTGLFVQDDAMLQIVVVLMLVATIGVLAERIFGHGRWLLLYFGCGMVGQAFGVLWLPDVNDAGASVAGAGLLGAVCAWLLSPGSGQPLRVRVWGPVWLLIGLVLTATKDMHGPPLLVGFALGAIMLWSDRRHSRGESIHRAAKSD